jgi:PAS domain S-box-containing protein
MPYRKQSREHAGQRAAEERMQTRRGEGGPFVAAVEATRMPMVVTDPGVEGNPIVYANAAFLDLCGYGMEEVLGQGYMFLAGADADPATADRIAAAVSARRALVEDVPFRRKDGRGIWVAAFVGPVVEDGRVVQHFASFLDITHRVELERRLAEARETLERRAAERTRRLQEANARLREEVERRTRVEAVLRDTLAEKDAEVRFRTVLAREVDHRARNALQMAGTLLSIHARAMEDPDCADALREAQARLTRIADVHAAMHRDEHPGSADLGAYLRELASGMAEARAAPGRVEIAVEAEEALWGPDLVVPLGMIAGEAVTNALKHAFPDGREGRIDVRLEAAGAGTMRLVVEDDGVGMRPERRPGALGLGLIRGLAEQVRGSALVEPGARGGTRVVVVFPAPEDPA